MNVKSSATSTSQIQSEIRQSWGMLSKTEIHSWNIFSSIQLYSLLFTGLPVTFHNLSWRGCLTRQPAFCQIQVFVWVLANQLEENVMMSETNTWRQTPESSLLHVVLDYVLSMGSTHTLTQLRAHTPFPVAEIYVCL